MIEAAAPSSGRLSTSWFLPIAAALLLVSGCASDTGLPWQPIFNGTDWSGWKVPEPNPFWTVEDGVIVGRSDAKKRGSLLVTDRTFGDVDFETEVRFEGDLDSGVFFRKPELQVQIGISRMYRRDLTGSIYAGGDYVGWAYGVQELWKPGTWNRLRVVVEGSRFRVHVNEVEVLDHYSDAFAGPGPIKLQIHQDVAMKIEFRNLRVRAL